MRPRAPLHGGAASTEAVEEGLEKEFGNTSAARSSRHCEPWSSAWPWIRASPSARTAPACTGNRDSRLVPRIFHARALEATRLGGYKVVRDTYGSPPPGADVKVWVENWVNQVAADFVHDRECVAVAGRIADTAHPITQTSQVINSRLETDVFTTPGLVRLISPCNVLVSGRRSLPTYQAWVCVAGCHRDLLGEPDVPQDWRFPPFANGTMHSCGFLAGPWGARQPRNPQSARGARARPQGARRVPPGLHLRGIPRSGQARDPPRGAIRREDPAPALCPQGAVGPDRRRHRLVKLAPKGDAKAVAIEALPRTAQREFERQKELRV